MESRSEIANATVVIGMESGPEVANVESKTAVTGIESGP